MKVYEQEIVRGTFLQRSNRFIVHMRLHGETVVCHMPNPGRLRELLFPGVTLYAVPTPSNKTKFRVVGVERDGEVIFLDTPICNDVAEWLVNNKKIPGWEQYIVARREVTMGDSRFDLLLVEEETGEAFPVEVKSSTLFGKLGAMFPDAVTTRGRKHIIHLGEIGRKSHAGVLILVHWDRAEWFLPDYHTDPDFAHAFADNASYIDLKVASLRWEKEFTMPEYVRLLPTNMDIIKKEGGNAGYYLLILQAKTNLDIDVGIKGHIRFPRGYYVYVGSAKENLLQNVNHHRYLRKRMHDDIDYLRQHTKFVGIIPIRTQDDWEADLVCAVEKISDWKIPEFGDTGCEYMPHLFGFIKDPMHMQEFTKIEEEFEINRLDTYFAK